VTQEILCSGTTRDIVGLVEQCNFPAEAFLLVERLPQQVVNDKRERENLLRFARVGDGIDFAPYTSGRIFNQHFELRWEKEAETTRVVYLGEEREIPELTKDKDTLQYLKPASNPKYYHLFGERLDKATLEDMGIEPEEGYYAEVRIPRLLHYPVLEQPQRVQLVVREYMDKETGRVQLFRFQGLKPAE